MPVAGSGQAVELVDAEAEPVGRPADLVQRDEPGATVERGVLGALRDDHAGRLLDPRRQLPGRVGRDLAIEGVERIAQIGTPLPCGLDRPGPVLVDRRGGRSGRRRTRSWSRRPRPARGPGRRRRAAPAIRRTSATRIVVGHQPASVLLDVGVVGVLAQLGGQRGQRAPHRPGSTRTPKISPQRVVAGRAVDGPAGRQRLAGVQDLLDHDPRLRAPLRAAAACTPWGRRARRGDRPAARSRRRRRPSAAPRRGRPRRRPAARR